MGQDMGRVAVMPVDWVRMKRAFPRVAQLPLLSTLVNEERSRVEQSAKPDTEAVEDEVPIDVQIGDLRGDERRPLLEDYLRKEIAGILFSNVEEITIDCSVMELGLDSIMVMELVGNVERDLQIKLYVREIFERPSIKELAAYVADELEQTQRLTEGSAGDDVKKSAIDVTSALGPGATLARRLNVPTSKPAVRSPGGVFLVSSPRSGSTLLRVMLAGHPDLFCPPELHLLPFEGMKDREDELADTYLTEGLQRAFMELKGLDTASAKALTADLVKRNVTVQQVYGMVQELASPRLLIDKSPSYAASPDTLARGEILFEGSKYIHLVRHPYAMIESFVRNRFDKMLGVKGADPTAFGEELWVMTNGNLLRFFENIDPSRRIVVRFEDLMAAPDETMEALCGFWAYSPTRPC